MPCALAAKSATVMIPLRVPWAFTTGTPPMWCSSIVRATSSSVVSSPTVTTDWVMNALICIVALQCTPYQSILWYSMRSCMLFLL